MTGSTAESPILILIQSFLFRYSPLSAVGMPFYSQPLLSQWPNSLIFTIGKVPSKIPPEVLKNVKMVDFVGYSPNPKTFRRNQAFNQAAQEGPKKPKFRSEQELEHMKNGTKKKVVFRSN